MENQITVLLRLPIFLITHFIMFFADRIMCWCLDGVDFKKEREVTKSSLRYFLR